MIDYVNAYEVRVQFCLRIPLFSKAIDRDDTRDRCFKPWAWRVTTRAFSQKKYKNNRIYMSMTDALLFASCEMTNEYT